MRLKSGRGSPIEQSSHSELPCNKLQSVENICISKTYLSAPTTKKVMVVILLQNAWAGTWYRFPSKPLSSIQELNLSGKISWRIKRPYALCHHLPENKDDQKRIKILHFSIFASSNTQHHTKHFFWYLLEKRKQHIKYTAKKNFSCK